MQVRTKVRSRKSAPLRMGGIGALALALGAAAQTTQPPAPIERRPPSSAQNSQSQPNTDASAPLNPAQRRESPADARGEHLADWINQHRNLTPDQQTKALEREPGFQSLPQQEQQRLRSRLSQLDAMTPDERRRLLAHNEAVERMTPEQRTEFRSVMSQLGRLPVDDRRTVARTFRALRDLPADQRISALDSGRYGPPLNDAQRSALYNLLRIEPIVPRSQR